MMNTYMPNDLTAENLIALSVGERKAMILGQAALVDASHIKVSPKKIDADAKKAEKAKKAAEKAERALRESHQISTVLTSIIASYVELKLAQDKQKGSVLEYKHQSQAIKAEVDAFVEKFKKSLVKVFQRDRDAIQDIADPLEELGDEVDDEDAMQIKLFETESLKKSKSTSKPPQIDNIFMLFDNRLLTISNAVTRSLSTATGHLCERLASISPYVVNPEIEFGLKITGVDLIIFVDGIPEFTQMKTQRNTLTGSQQPRVKQELGIYDNSLFVAAFDVGSWTFKSDEIDRIAGMEFWQKIRMDYGLIESHVKDGFCKIEDAYVEEVRNWS